MCRAPFYCERRPSQRVYVDRTRCGKEPVACDVEERVGRTSWEVQVFSSSLCPTTMCQPSITDTYLMLPLFYSKGASGPLGMFIFNLYYVSPLFLCSTKGKRVNKDCFCFFPHPPSNFPFYVFPSPSSSQSCSLAALTA